MKRKLLTIILTAAVIAEALTILTLPAFAWSWKDNGKFEVAEHRAPIVESGSIVLDARLDDAYICGNKIEGYPDDAPYRRPDYNTVYDLARGDFIAYIAVDTNGLYVYAEIEDETIFPSTNSNGNDGDCFQIYLDWCPEGVVHPSSEELYSMYQNGSAWNYEAYKKNYAKNQHLGWLSGDYYGVYCGWGGFSSVNAMGPNKNEKVIYKTRFTNDGWACEWFIPWRDQAQKNAVSNGDQFHIGIGFQSSDDSDINNTVTPNVEENVGIVYDQRREIGGSYWANYSMLADLVLTKACAHDWRVTEKADKTCLVYGYENMLCPKCSGEKTVIYPASHGEETEHICSVKNKKAVVCADCGEILRESTAFASGESHFYESTGGKAPSCTEGGYEELKCRYCGFETEQNISANGHDCYYSNKLGLFVCRECDAQMSLGDVNGDGYITNSDVLEIFRYIYDPELYPIYAPAVADVDENGYVTNSDVLEIFRYIYNPELYPLTKRTEPFQLNGAQISEYTIVYIKNDKMSASLAEKLREAIKAASGTDIKVIDDSEPYREGREILVGHSKRLSGAASSLGAAAQKLSDTEYIVAPEGKFLYLGGREGDRAAMLASVNRLIDELESAKENYIDINTSGVAGTKYSIITYNDGDNSTTNTTQITAILNEYDPDIIGFQETQEIHLSVYDKKLGYKYDYVYFDNDGTTYNSQPIYYKKDKFTLIESGIKWLSNTPDVRSKFNESAYTRSFTYAVLRDKTTGKDIVVVNTHIDYTSVANVMQMKKLIELTKQYWDKPVFYTADYNVGSTSAGYAVMKESGFVDCGSSLGYSVAGHIDFCFVDLDLSIPVAFDYINHHEYSATASDHPPVYAEILVYFE